MLTIKFPRHDPCLSARDLTHTAPAQPGNGEPGVACSASDFRIPRPSATRASGGVPLCFLATFEIYRDDTICRQGCCRNSGRQRDSLIGEKITLIARFTSTSGSAARKILRGAGIRV